ncbi:MAG: biotin transporter BioY [Firmicutes bacterium]|nr:biotin transporter BioY [Bacillota bacterium]
MAQIGKWSPLDMAYIALATVIMMVCAWISIPTMIPFTLQTLGIFLCAGLLGPARGTAAILIYLGLGMAGLPVFSGFRGGLGIVLGPTGGYLLGFLLAVPLSGWLMQRCGGKSIPSLLGMGLGLLLVYLCGTLWNVCVYAPETGASGFLAALSVYVLPFILPDIGKLVLAWFLCRRLQPYVKSSRQRAD